MQNHFNLSRRRFLMGTVSTTVLSTLSPRLAIGAEKAAGSSTRLNSKIYGHDAYPVYFRKATPLSAPRVRFAGFKPSVLLLKKGSIRREGALPLPCDIIYERDVALSMRDGTKIYTDIFRPVGEGKFPAIVNWSPYGKIIGGQWLDDVKGRSGVPLSSVSELQKFEAADPAFWCNQGYVVLNPDPRGAYKSEGNISYWGRQLAEDGYDFIEWAARQKWCSGKVALSGNSWLAVSQWFIAAEQPPHLAAIAPWEGFTDHFRDTGNRGGIPSPAFSENIIAGFGGENLVEDQPRMIVEQQTMTPYWQDKIARLERITVPAYVVASYTNPVHTRGTFDGFRHMASPEKWLRVNNTNEWQDYYTPKYCEELLAFFDYYLKGKQNGWNKTPRVRIAVLDDGGEDIVDRVEESFPPKSTEYRPLYLAQNGQLAAQAGKQTLQTAYDAQTGKLELYHEFTEDTELTGYMKLKLWVEAKGADDMELSVSVEKRDANNQPYQRLLGEGMMGAASATGLLRVSQRALDKKRSTAIEPYHLHTHEQRLQAGEIVPVEIGIWPMAMLYHKGQRLVLTIKPHKPTPTQMDIGFGTAKIEIPADGGTFMPDQKPAMLTLGGSRELDPLVISQRVTTPESRNKGTHIVHFGGQYDSHLLVSVNKGRYA